MESALISVSGGCQLAELCVLCPGKTTGAREGRGRRPKGERKGERGRWEGRGMKNENEEVIDGCKKFLIGTRNFVGV